MDYFKSQTDEFMFLEYTPKKIERKIGETITMVDETQIELSREEGGENIIIDTSEFHNYFLANYASTAHKSQGATYQGKVILWDWDRMTDDKKLCYTACSRAVSLDNLTISTGIL